MREGILKNRLFIVIAMLSFGLFGLTQRNDWYEPALELPAGWMELGRMPNRPVRVDAHVRFKAPQPLRAASVALAWNVEDSLNYRYARIRVPAQADGIYMSCSSLCIGEMHKGIDRTIDEYELASDYGYVSMRLIYDGFSARLRLKDEAYPVEYDVDGAGGVWMLCDTPIFCRRLTALGSESVALERAKVENPDSLLAAVAASADANEGIWEYLDRDIRAGAATLGGLYRLATVKNTQGKYDVVYLGGAEDNASRWEPLMLKGELSPTIFTGHFDLRWIDSSGTVLERECNAQLDPNGAILTFRFPLQDSQLRFRRVVK